MTRREVVVASAVTVAASPVILVARPAGHFRPDGTLRPSARPYPSVRPDLDKYVRATLDALGTAGAYLDDGQVVELCVSKAYADGVPPGAHITVTSLESP